MNEPFSTAPASRLSREVARLPLLLLLVIGSQAFAGDSKVVGGVSTTAVDDLLLIDVGDTTPYTLSALDNDFSDNGRIAACSFVAPFPS